MSGFESARALGHGRGVSTASFRLSQTIAAPAGRIYAHLSEPASFLGLQPLLIEVTETDRGEDAAGRPTRTFRCVEKLRLLEEEEHEAAKRTMKQER